uniref:Uncharacterized protein n=1 Tax=Megaselia scalaris TaxID=36166 RepID=T1GTB1_MEGSC
VIAVALALICLVLIAIKSQNAGTTYLTREEQSTVVPLINDIVEHLPHHSDIPNQHDLEFVKPVGNSNTIYGDKYQVLHLAEH